MAKENLVKKLGKKVLPYFMAGALVFGGLSRCVDNFVDPNSEKPDNPVTMLAPVAMLTANPTEGDAPLEVSFDGSLSYARTPKSYLKEYHWDFDGDGNTDKISGQNWINHTYEEAGEYDASLVVVDNLGQISDKALETIVVNEENLPRLMWVRNIDFGRRQESAQAIGITPSDQIVVGGHSISGGMIYGAFGGLDSDGNVKWTCELEQGTDIIDMTLSNINSFFVTGMYGILQDTLCGEINDGGTLIIDPVLNKFPGKGGIVIQYFNNRIYIGETDGNMAITESDCSFLERMTIRENSWIRGLSIGQDYILASGDFYDTEGSWNIAGFVRKLDRDGNLLWERIYDDHFYLQLVEQDGMVYVGGTQFSIDQGPQFMFVSQLDHETGAEHWKSLWDGGTADPSYPYYTWGHFSRNLIPNPSGGVVLIPQLEEFPGSNPNCPIGDPNCWDFGAWAVDPAGNTLWTIRQDFNNSYWDISNDAFFDSEGNLIIAGRSIPNPEINDDTDVTVAKFKVPSNR